MANKIQLIPITLDDGTANTDNIQTSNKIVVYVPRAGENSYGIVTLTEVDGRASTLISAHNSDSNTTAHQALFNSKQDKLTFDNTPELGSSNPVTSDGIASSIIFATNVLDNAKQSKYDTNIETPGHTVVGGINNLKGRLDNLNVDISNDISTAINNHNSDANTTAHQGLFNNVMAVAEGKCASYTISDVTNADFNSSNDTITLAVSGTITDTLGNTINFSDLKVGDVIYVTETDVPDRWVGSKDSSNIVFYKMESTKVDLTTKVDKTTGTYKLYGTDSSGNQTTLPYDTYPAGSFVRRDGNSQITVPLTPTANGHATSKQYVDTKQDIIQYDTLPTASADNVGHIVQYIGTTGTYTNGYFYKCVENDGVYSWSTVNVQDGGNAVTLGTEAQTFAGDKTLNIGNNKKLTFSYDSGGGGSESILIGTLPGSSARAAVSVGGTTYYTALRRGFLTIKESNSNYSINLERSGFTGAHTIALLDDIPTALTTYQVQDIVTQSLYTAYTITVSVTNGTYVGNAYIGNTAEVVVTANSGYSLPASITVTGATYTWNDTTGKIELSAPTGNVTISVVCA